MVSLWCLVSAQHASAGYVGWKWLVGAWKRTSGGSGGEVSMSGMHPGPQQCIKGNGNTADYELMKMEPSACGKVRIVDVEGEVYPLSTRRTPPRGALG